MTKTKDDSAVDGLENGDFYVPVGPAAKAFILPSLFYLMPCIIWFPQYLPSPEYTGPFGWFFYYLHEEHLELIRFVFLASILVHMGEALCALTFCVYLGVDGPNTARWVWSTCLYGGFSLRHLIGRLYHDELARKSEPYDAAADIAKMQ